MGCESVVLVHFVRAGEAVSDEIKVGDIWSARYTDRRARVVRIWSGGDVSLRTVELIGDTWRDKKGGKCSTCRPLHLSIYYRLLTRAA